MITYIVKGDLLNQVEGIFRNFSGRIVLLPQQYGKGWYYGGALTIIYGIKNHLLDAVKKGIKQEGKVLNSTGGGGGGLW